MNIKLDCAVCGYQQVEGSICPNCDTDLSLIRSLMELPSIPENSVIVYAEPTKPKGSIIPLALPLIGLILGGAFGFVANSLIMQPKLVVQYVPIPTPPIIKPESKQTSPQANFKSTSVRKYVVKKGDTLTQIAEKFCGAGSRWQTVVEVNFQLIGRENSLEVGEVLQIPDCKGRETNVR